MKLEQTIRHHLKKLPLPLQGEVLDYVLYLEQKARKQSATDSGARVRLASALERIVAMNPFAATDSAAWAREQRHDRALPGRDAG